MHTVIGGGQMNEVSAEHFRKGLECYDPENRVFPHVAEKIAKGEELTERDVLLILKWKLYRTKDSYADTVAKDKLIEINRAVAEAQNPDRRVEAVEALDKIPGIGLATATAILTVCYPDQFSIIDWRVLETLELHPTGLASEKRGEYDASQWKAKSYVDEFLPKVKERSEVWGCTLRDADRALWGLSVNRNIEGVIRKSVRTLSV
jgi:hypothetical protein